MKKMIINKCYGGFGISMDAIETLNITLLTSDIDSDIAKIIGINDPYDDEKNRCNPILIKLVESGHGEEIAASYAKLQVVTIPDNATDYYISEYDGYETLVYVVNGKLHFA